MSRHSARLKALSTPLLGAAIALLTWPYLTFGPSTGIDPSWISGLYMATDRGMNFGTEIIFSYGPLGFLDFPGTWAVELGRLAFLWSAAVQVVFCIALLWCARRAFGLVFGLAITLFATALPSSDRILIIAAVAGVAVLLGEWSRRARIVFAVGAGIVGAIEMLVSFRTGPTLVLMTLVVLLVGPGRRQTLAAYAASLATSFLVLWFAAGQGLGNLGEFGSSGASVLSGYSSAMVYVLPGDWWQVPALIVGPLAVGGLCAAAAWQRDTTRRIGLALLVAAVVFLMFKHAVVRYTPGSVGTFLVALLTIGLALVPYVRRSLAIAAIAVLGLLAYVGNDSALEVTFDLPSRVDAFGQEVKIVATPGRAAEEQRKGREALQAHYALTPKQLALLRSGTVHVASLEAAVAWAYELDWDPLPIFQQYAAYTAHLDRVNAAKLESASAPDRILWENQPAVDPTFVDVRPYPGTIDRRIPAWDSPAQMVQMLCRYRVEQWDERFAILRRSADRCGPERPLESVEVGSGEPVDLPATRRHEALLVRVHGLGPSAAERLGSFLFRGAGRSTVLAGQRWNVIAATAGDGLLLRVPAWADYPGPFALDSRSSTVSFERESGFLTGIGGSGSIRLEFSALPLARAAPAR